MSPSRAQSKRAPPGELRIGTSGWIYKHWEGRFYPPKLPAADRLAFYAARYTTVEVNFSFYRLPERSMFETWARATPPDFLFAVKASRFLTHMKKLKDPEEPLARLLDHAAGLGPKLGPILFQLPPWWPADRERLATFLAALAPYRPQRFAFEFRHASWLVPAIYELLVRAGAALCLPVGPGVPVDPRRTATWTYLRFHSGSRSPRFTARELGIWAPRIRGVLARGGDSYVYFNNDTDGHALRDAVRFAALVEPEKAQRGRMPFAARQGELPLGPRGMV